MNWLPWPLIPKRQWPAVEFKDKRAITWEEHQAIVARDVNGARKVRGVMGVTRVLEKAKPPLTMKHVLSYGTMERDTQTSIGGGGESWTDSSGDGDALADAEKDTGAQSAAGLPATTTPAQNQVGALSGATEADA
jgi:hypothetical protein